MCFGVILKVTIDGCLSMWEDCVPLAARIGELLCMNHLPTRESAHRYLLYHVLCFIICKILQLQLILNVLAYRNIELIFTEIHGSEELYNGKLLFIE